MIQRIGGGKWYQAKPVGQLLFLFCYWQSWIIFALINFNKSDKMGPQVGQAAPDFSLPDLVGNQLSLTDLRGKVILLNFWGSWCDPCKKEMPDLEQVYQAYKDKGVVVLGVNIGESKVTAKGFMDRLGITFPTVLDADRDVTLNKYKIGPIPTSFFIDRKGVIQHVYTGPMSAGYIENQIQTLLSQQ
ncbi:redoxin domain-containing protein [Effusibacillus consociatus]|uniref:Redoxin domain-containing protein n=1 Tax=Effusibacillus consociatus TaxID=1117041 RepID=A0ABV9Q7P1_9BACL